MTTLYQNRQIRDLENYVTTQTNTSEFDLMQAAGLATWRFLWAKWPYLNSIAVFCGKGNNAGDGYVLAKIASENGLRVAVYSLCDIDELKGSAKKAAQECQQQGVSIQPYSDQIIFNVDLVVDALLGTGLTGEVKDPYLSAIHLINKSPVDVLSIDVPSGLNSDTGDVHGEAIKATATITFIGLKQGLFTGKAPAYCGEIGYDNLGIEKEAFANIQPSAEVIDWGQIKPLLIRRSRVAFKGTYGHVLVIGGDYGMGGAVRMAAEAAMRVGAGLVSVATRPEHVPVVNCSRPEIMCHQVASPKDLDPLLEKATVIVIGPGLGKTDWAKQLLKKILETSLPKVLDADALNLLSEEPQTSDQWVLTPHPGEASRLLDVSCQSIQENRFNAAKELQTKYHGVVALKGVGTIVQTPTGIPKVCRAGNPGMATGGMGDILSGVIGGFLAQRLGLAHAAEAGVFIHSLAADRAAAEGGERGLLATDLMLHLRDLVNPL